MVEYTYDSWGELISITGSLASTIGVKNPLRYRGYYYDTETSLYYLQARYYDPDTGRFICADTLLIAGNDYIQGINRYAYCYNNPVMYVDPTGYAGEFYFEILPYINLFLIMVEKANIIMEPILTLYNKLYGEAESDMGSSNDYRDIEAGKSIAAVGNYVGMGVDVMEITGEDMGPLGNALSIASVAVDVGSDLIDPRLNTEDKIISVGEGTFSLVSGLAGAVVVTTITTISAPIGVGSSIVLGGITYVLWKVAEESVSKELFE